MEDDLPQTIVTNSNPEQVDNLKPDSVTPWSSDPDVSKEPEITVTLPEDSTITEVTLRQPENVEDFTVTVTDSDGNTNTVRKNN